MTMDAAVLGPPAEPPHAGPFAIEELVHMAERAVIGAGAPITIAERVAAMLVDADARNIASHGLSRLPSYLRRARAGLIDPNATPQVLIKSQATALIDGANGYGVSAADLACSMASDCARRLGVGWATTVRSNHVGALGFFVRELARADLIALMWSNAAPSVCAHNGRFSILGTNPIAMAAPRHPNPVVLDMATSAVARGRVRRALAEGQDIPLGWGVDATGTGTVDPSTALAGALLPLGGAKGYGLSVFVEILSGVLGGGDSLDDVYDTEKLSSPSAIAFTVVALDPERFTTREQFDERLESVIARLKASGENEILMPGEREDAAYETAQNSGVVLARDVYENLVREAGR